MFTKVETQQQKPVCQAVTDFVLSGVCLILIIVALTAKWYSVGVQDFSLSDLRSLKGDDFDSPPWAKAVTAALALLVVSSVVSIAVGVALLVVNGMSYCVRWVGVVLQIVSGLTVIGTTVISLVAIVSDVDSESEGSSPDVDILIGWVASLAAGVLALIHSGVTCCTMCCCAPQTTSIVTIENQPTQAQPYQTLGTAY